jgi:hypothetical protein
MRGWEGVGMSTVSCSVAGCDISDIEPSGRATTVLVLVLNISSCA